MWSTVNVNGTLLMRCICSISRCPCSRRSMTTIACGPLSILNESPQLKASACARRESSHQIWLLEAFFCLSFDRTIEQSSLTEFLLNKEKHVPDSLSSAIRHCPWCASPFKQVRKSVPTFAQPSCRYQTGAFHYRREDKRINTPHTRLSCERRLLEHLA